MRNNANCQRQKVSFKGTAEHKYLDCSLSPSLSSPPLRRPIHPPSATLSFARGYRRKPSRSSWFLKDERDLHPCDSYRPSRDEGSRVSQDSRRSDTRGAPWNPVFHARFRAATPERCSRAMYAPRESTRWEIHCADTPGTVVYVYPRTRPSADVLHLCRRRAKMKRALATAERTVDIKLSGTAASTFYKVSRSLCARTSSPCCSSFSRGTKDSLAVSYRLVGPRDILRALLGSRFVFALSQDEVPCYA